MSVTSVLVAGSANVDLVAHVARCPRGGETLIGRSFKTVCGGKGANQAVAAARLGGRTWFAGCVGADSFGAMQRQALSEAGVDVSYLKTDPKEPTGTALITVEDSGQNAIVVIPSANYGLTPVDVQTFEPLIVEMDVLLLQLEIPMPVVEAALEAARRLGIISILDAGPAQAVPGNILACADVVSPNESEVEAITGVTIRSLADAELAASRLKAMGAREVVLKLGANGAWYSGDETFHVPAFSITPVDTTAAGDAFTAALAVEWKHRSRRDAIRFANAAGALAATVAGAQPSMPTRAAVEAFLADQKS